MSVIEGLYCNLIHNVLYSTIVNKSNLFNKIRRLLPTLTDCGGAGVMVTEGDRSLTPGGNPEGGRPMELLWGGWGTERLVRLFSGVAVIEGTWTPDRGRGCCCKKRKPSRYNDVSSVNFYNWFQTQARFIRYKNYSHFLKKIIITIPRYSQVHSWFTYLKLRRLFPGERGRLLLYR